MPGNKNINSNNKKGTTGTTIAMGSMIRKVPIVAQQ
jgi:hypothetical protein